MFLNDLTGGTAGKGIAGTRQIGAGHRLGDGAALNSQGR